MTSIICYAIICSRHPDHALAFSRPLTTSTFEHTAYCGRSCLFSTTFTHWSLTECHRELLQGKKMWMFSAIMTCVRLVVLLAIVGPIAYIVYDITRSDVGTKSKTGLPAPSISKIGDTVTMNANTVACPTPEDVAKVRDLLSKYSDRQFASSYVTEHRCVVLAKSKGYKVEAHSAGREAECLQLPGQQQCYWAPVDALAFSPR